MDLIATDNLSAEQRRMLEVLAEMIIPASREYSLPGANDPKIFEDVLSSVQADLPGIITGLHALDELSVSSHDSAFMQLDEQNRLMVVSAFKSSQAQCANLILTTVVRCYYRDDRVMASLGMEPRAPYPDGFEVEDGDWSLLDPVRQRASFYRSIP